MRSMGALFLVIFVSLIFGSAIIKFLMFRGKDRKKLPPGPSFLSSHLTLLTHSLQELEPILKKLKSMYGPLINLSFGSRHFIFVASHSLAHEILIQKGAIFSDRPRFLPVCNITSASYGSTWRILRRNLALEMLHPSRVKSFSSARKWALSILITRLKNGQKDSVGIKVVDHFQYAMFCLFVVMCFGEKLDEDRMNEISSVQRRLMLLLGSRRFNVLRVFPTLGKILLRKRWKEFQQRGNDLEQVLTPLIKSRIERADRKPQSVGDEQFVAYVDTFTNLQLPKEEANNENDGKLTYKEMVNMCAEFLNLGTDTTFTSLQWIMANLVKHPHIQSKLYQEIVTVVGPPPPGVKQESVINQDNLQKMPYLKAVVLEGLRRHPPVHFVLHHRVMKEVSVQGYTIPEGATINFMVGEMGLDPNVWDDPLEFKPERFLANSCTNSVFDITGNKGIKMMPFGAGRRICTGADLALLHLEYFVANLIWYFHWTTPEGYHVDLSEKVEFTIAMKNPLQAQITPRAANLMH